MKLRSILLVSAAALFLAGCNSGGAPSNPLSSIASIYAPTGVWTLANGTAVLDSGDAVSFVFPKDTSGAHSLIKGPERPLQAGQTITAVFEITGDGTNLKPTDSDPPARVRLFFERSNDYYSGSPPYDNYRWYSSAYVDLVAPGTFTLSCQIDPALWTNVLGKPGTDNPAAFTDAVANIGNIGLVFGGMFAAHGIVRITDVVSGFRLISFELA